MISSSTTTTPMLNLRMRCVRTAPSQECDEDGTPDDAGVVDKVKVMLSQASVVYKCRDYLARRMEESDEDECPSLVPDDTIDAVCREKMCEWSYRVGDHFHTGREVVAISFSYLDRFLDGVNCDRTSFKLAAMTTLYMATKIHARHQIALSSLAELSRGEFEISQIEDMEAMILEALDWRLNPPTAQSFVDAFFDLVPVPSGSQVSNTIYQRAIFFTELSLYDYSFVSTGEALIAVAALLNSMEGMDELDTQEQQQPFLDALEEQFGAKFSEELLEMVRNRLWYVYSMTAQYKDDTLITATPVVKKSPAKQVVAVSDCHSPVTVAIESQR